MSEHPDELFLIPKQKARLINGLLLILIKISYFIKNPPLTPPGRGTFKWPLQ